MNRSQLTARMRSIQSYLCVGLDSDLAKIPTHLLSEKDPVFEFNRSIIEATKDHCVAYKINTAFYEAMGAKGWETLEKTVNYIPDSHFKIADAKRGDIGNTSSQYARAFFETLQFDAITVAPYMGEDSVRPFLEYPDKWTIVLGLTSNPGAADFELQPSGEILLYERVLKTVATWGSPENLMFVIGATRPEWLESIRRITPQHFYLIPGVGSQGGSLTKISEKALISDVGILVNVSRNIIYASDKEDFAKAVQNKAHQYQQQMAAYF